MFDASTSACCAQVIVKRGEPIPEGSEGPIVICTRNDSLAEIVSNTPEDRREGVHVLDRHAQTRAQPACASLALCPPGKATLDTRRARRLQVETVVATFVAPCCLQHYPQG